MIPSGLMTLHERYRKSESVSIQCKKTLKTLHARIHDLFTPGMCKVVFNRTSQGLPTILHMLNDEKQQHGEHRRKWSVESIWGIEDFLLPFQIIFQTIHYIQEMDKKYVKIQVNGILLTWKPFSCIPKAVVHSRTSL